MSVAKKNDPCSICKNYMVGVACQNEACPVFEMKVENLRLKKTIYNLRSQINKMKSDASWDDDIRRGQVQGMW